MRKEKSRIEKKYLEMSICFIAMADVSLIMILCFRCKRIMKNPYWNKLCLSDGLCNWSCTTFIMNITISISQYRTHAHYTLRLSRIIWRKNRAFLNCELKVYIFYIFQFVFYDYLPFPTQWKKKNEIICIC